MQKNLPLSLSIQREIEKHRLSFASKIDQSVFSVHPETDKNLNLMHNSALFGCISGFPLAYSET